MKKHLLPLIACFVLACSLTACKDTGSAFSPGAGDPRITGTWQLYERRFIKDSIYTVRIDTIVTTRDTSFYSLKRYSASTPQTLTFDTNGQLNASGPDMTYYYPVKYFRVDSTSQEGLVVNLFISTNRANIPFRQQVEFRRDTLVLKPRCLDGQCDEGYYLKLLRVR